MASFTRNTTTHYLKSLIFIILFIKTLSFDPIPLFSFVDFEKDLKFKSNVAFFGNAKVVNGESKIQLSDTGRVIYKKPVKLFQDGAKGVRNVKGDFFNETSSGFSLGLKSNDFEVVGVEFSVSRDGKNEILIRNGVSSKIYVTNLVLTSGEKMHTWIDYEASSMRLEVRLSKNGNSKPFDPLLWDKIETSNVLKDEEMFVGFSPVKETSAFLYSWSFVLRHFPPHSMHSEPLDPKVFVKNSENPMVVESKEKGKSDCFLRVLAAMIFGTGCGALTAFSVLYLWTIFGNKRGAVVPEGCVMQGLDGDYRKVKIVVDNKTIGDGNK
ncbi:unnamed protein product [Vicia faba]|uniref:Legume lectin domain-containing protein n=1 Tax=Vicia faba TaxID=3906 RepID=A0AAV0ZSH8_VICFA|nr:unnamed protein product [Vicia faba]